MISLDEPLFDDSIPLMADLNPALPNVKELFRPDPGFILLDADLAQADARIVAWDADDLPLKKIFNDGLDLHTENAKAIGVERQAAKAGVHATNYNVQARTLAATLHITVSQAQAFISKWFFEHPNILKWHERISDEMRTRGYIQNPFGNRKYFLGDTSHATALSEALAWIPQSTVGLIINRAWVSLAQLPKEDVQILLQVHDSLVFQVRRTKFHSLLPAIHKALHVLVPYSDPLVIPSSLDGSYHSWGRVKAIDWDGNWVDSGEPAA